MKFGNLKVKWHKYLKMKTSLAVTEELVTALTLKSNCARLKN